MATCSRLMKGQIWYYKVFFHMLEAAVLNAHILHQKASHPDTTLGQFKETLVQQLIGGTCFCHQDRSQILPDTHFNHMLFHHPVVTETHRKCKVHIQWVDTSYECGICMSACVQHHVFRGTTTYTRTFLMIHQEMAPNGYRMLMVDQGLDLVGH